MRTIYIGDVHGCYREMMELLSKIGPGNSDRIFFVGDVINKGPDSKKVIETIRKNGYRSIMGNHEWSYLKYYTAQTHPASWFPQLTRKKAIFDTLLQTLSDEENHWLANLPFYLDTPEFLLVHAGIFPDRSLSDHRPHEILNVRKIQGRPWHEYYMGEKLIVYGHWALQGLMVKENSVGLDSGCVYGKKLSALILPERKIVQVDSQTSVL